MSQRTTTSSLPLLMGVLLLAGVLVGFVGAKVFSFEQTSSGLSSTSMTTQTTEAQWRTTWNRVWLKQTMHTHDVMLAVSQERQDATQAKRALATINSDAEAAMEIAYSEQVAAEWSEIWQKRNQALEAYAQAVSAEDSSALGDARRDLEQANQQVNDFLQSELGMEQAVDAMLEDYDDALIRSLDAYIAENFQEAYQQREQSITRSQELADKLSEAIMTNEADEF